MEKGQLVLSPRSLLLFQKFSPPLLDSCQLPSTEIQILRLSMACLIEPNNQPEAGTIQHR